MKARNLKIKELLEEFGPVKWFDHPINGYPWQGWFLLEVSPLPLPEHRELVVADICNDGLITVSKGKLFHSEKCIRTDHSLKKHLSKAILSIKETTFLVAVYAGETGLLQGQPVAVVLDPDINYDLYPDHPHLNTMVPLKVNGVTSYCIPDSLCYTDDPAGLNKSGYGRLLTAFDLICIWLFRHQVWLATREQGGTGLWIGPSAPMETKFLAYRLNPLGPCWCGRSDIHYRDCHMIQDVIEINNCSREKAIEIIDRLILNRYWPNYINAPYLDGMQKLTRALIH